jgi:transcriptional regulator with XRE-family HTH domain
MGIKPYFDLEKSHVNQVGTSQEISRQRGQEEVMNHWTQANTSDFAYSISLDFFTQLDDRIEESGISRKELSEKLNVTPSAVSQTLNNPPENPHLETLVQYARQLGLKVAIVSYDDDDPDNDKGPIYSGIFEKSWKAMGCPRDLSMFNEHVATANPTALILPFQVRANKPMMDVFGMATKQTKIHKEVENVTGGQYVQKAAGA